VDELVQTAGLSPLLVPPNRRQRDAIVIDLAVAFSLRTADVAPMDPLLVDYNRAIAYLYERINYERTADSVPYPFRLRRMHQLVASLDLADICGRNVPLVHIAGTKGKGSTASMVATMLSAGGYRVGLYTSPHLIKLEERFTVNGELASERDVIALIDLIAPIADDLGNSDLGSPTFFEFTTAMALLYFKQRNCTAVVLEVGLGGKLDSTNVCTPTVTAITSIGYDHQHILGNTLAEIAAQKAGIIKPGVPVVSGTTEPEAREVIERIAAQTKARLYAIGDAFEVKVVASEMSKTWSTCFDLISHDTSIRPREHWSISLDGYHQAANAAVACTIMDQLTARGIDVPIEAQETALADVRIAGRVERFPFRPGVDVILDTSHNIDSIAALCRCVQARRGDRPVTVVFGTSRDKHHIPMLAELCEVADAILLTRYHNNPRFREPQDLMRDLPASRTTIASIQDDPVTAVRESLSRVTGSHLIVVCGSFFLAAEIRPLLESMSK